MAHNIWKREETFYIHDDVEATSGGGMSVREGKEGLMWEGGRDGRRAGGKGDVVNFPGIPQSCETASAPSTFVNVCVCGCVPALGCVFSAVRAFPLSETQAVN